MAEYVRQRKDDRSDDQAEEAKTNQEIPRHRHRADRGALLTPGDDPVEACMRAGVYPVAQVEPMRLEEKPGTHGCTQADDEQERPSDQRALEETHD